MFKDTNLEYKRQNLFGKYHHKIRENCRSVYEESIICRLGCVRNAIFQQHTVKLLTQKYILYDYT